MRPTQPAAAFDPTERGPNSRGVSGGRTVALSGFAGAVLYLIGALLPGSPAEE